MTNIITGVRARTLSVPSSRYHNKKQQWGLDTQPLPFLSADLSCFYSVRSNHLVTDRHEVDSLNLQLQSRKRGNVITEYRCTGYNLQGGHPAVIAGTVGLTFRAISLIILSELR